MTTPTDSPWLSRAEAAEYLGVTDRTLDRLVREGRLARYRVADMDRLVRFKRDELDALLEDFPMDGESPSPAEVAQTS